MEASKVIDTLIATATHLDIDKPGFPVNQTMYRGIIGSLLYLTVSRPDIVFSVGLCARFQSNPKESHLKADKRILRYLKGTKDLVLYYPSGDNFDLIGYAGADYVGYLVDRKNTSGMVDTHDDYRANRQLMQYALVKIAKVTDARLVREPGSLDPG
ncbi:secreted RxLR effector protein 161-like [Nicotiana tomentosiformis]|uniref:secreted RxLR effector protein 161-like n=1 Tax=Nicotiana tomentosiformis TaxID=4098 RepID=UPI00388CA93C